MSAPACYFTHPGLEMPKIQAGAVNSMYKDPLESNRSIHRSQIPECSGRSALTELSPETLAGSQMPACTPSHLIATGVFSEDVFSAPKLRSSQQYTAIPEQRAPAKCQAALQQGFLGYTAAEPGSFLRNESALGDSKSGSGQPVSKALVSSASYNTMRSPQKEKECPVTGFERRTSDPKRPAKQNALRQNLEDWGIPPRAIEVLMEH